jgi:hypothetical protein
VVAAIQEYLDAPEYGGLGEAELARLGREGEADWSVGFVSVAAGVLQAAAFVQIAERGLDEVAGSRSERRLLFWSDQLASSPAMRRPDCPVCSVREMQEQWAELWNP